MNRTAGNLSAIQLVKEAYRGWSANRGAWLIALALPAAIDVVVNAAFWRHTASLVDQVQQGTDREADLETLHLETFLGDEMLLRFLALVAVNIIAMTLFAVSWHRLALLGERPRLIPEVRSEHIRFALVAFALVFGLSSILMVGFAFTLVQPAGMATILALILALLVYIKLSMLLPAAAVGVPCRIQDAWRMTSGQVLPLFWASLLALLPILMVLLSGALPGLFGEGLLADIVLLAVAVLLNYFTLAMMVAIISLAYKEITRLPLAGNKNPTHGT